MSRSHTPLFDPPKTRGAISSSTVDAVPADPSGCVTEMVVVGVSGALYPSGGETNGQLVARGDYVYMWGETYLTIVDVSDPTNPTVVGQATDASIEDLRWGFVLDGDYIYIAEGDAVGGFHVFNVANPASPSHVAYYNDGDVGSPGDTFTGATIGGLIKEGNLIYAVDWSWSSVYVVNVSTPSVPFTAGYFVPTFSGDGPYASDEWDIIKSGSYLYATSYYDGSLLIFDVSNPASITWVGYVTESVLDGTFMGPVKHGSIVCMTSAASFATISVATPSAPVMLDSITSTAYLPDPEGSMIVEGDYAYVPSWDGVLTIIDVSDPTAIVIVGTVTSVQLFGAGGRIIKRGNRILIPCYWGGRPFPGGGLLVGVNVFDPTAPFIESWAYISNPNSGLDMDVAGDYAYVESGEKLYVVRLCSPDYTLSLLGFVAHANLGGATNVAFTDYSGSIHAAVTTFNNDRVTIVNVDDPTSPTVVSSVTHANINNCVGIARAQDYSVVVANQQSDAVVHIEVTTPATPTIVGSMVNATTLDGATGIAAAPINAAVYVVACQTSNRVTVIAGYPGTIQGSVQNNTLLLEAYDVVIADDSYTAYVACYLGNRLTVVDCSTFTAPTVIGSVTHTDLNRPGAVAKIGNVVYVACGDAGGIGFKGVVAVNVSDPTNPVVVGSLTDALLARCSGIAAIGSAHVVAVGSNSDSLCVINVYDPNHMRIEDSIVDSTTLGGAHDVDVWFVEGRPVIAVTCFSTGRLSLFTAT